MSAPRSREFDDIYFSPENGLAETQHVFLTGNTLPERWQNRDRFHIGELGFGTGLNALAAAKLFLETAKPHQHLIFSSVEKFPLSPAEIRDALTPFASHFGPLLETYLGRLPLRIRGEHPLRLHDQITLILHYGPVEDVLPRLDAPVDAWFLDGFAPAKNPEMWQDSLYNVMREKSASGATFATFTAAGMVKRGLAAAGFTVRKIGGYGRKRDMLAGEIGTSLPPLAAPRTGRIAVIGAGLAGTAAAKALSDYGLDVTIHEAGDAPGNGASGNPLGLINPRFTKTFSEDAHFYGSAYALAARSYKAMDGISHDGCGNLHLITTDMRDGKLRGAAQNWGWHKDHIALLTPHEASDHAGVTLSHEAVLLPDGAAVDPGAVCRALASGIALRTASAPRLGDLAADIVILANGWQAKDYLPDLPLDTVRGQISFVSATDISTALRCNLQYGGYLSRARNGRHILGATFQPWLTDTALRDEDHLRLAEELAEAVPTLTGLPCLGGRAALRTTTKHRKPLIGAVDDRLYITTAHGSHGLTTSLWGGWLLAKSLALGFITKKALSS